MNRYIYKIYSFLGFTRSERNASLFVIVLIVAVLLVRHINRPAALLPLDMTDKLVQYYDSLNESDKSILDIAVSPVDPNYATMEELTAAGFSKRQATTLINYRAKGGRFSGREEIKKIYGMDDASLERVMPNLKFPIPGNVSISAEAYLPPDRLSLTQLREESSSIAGMRVDLNSCDSTALIALPGIGPVLAGRIISYRNILGGYFRSNQLSEVYGLTDSVIMVIEPGLFIDTTEIRRISINTASFEDLLRHPYLELYDVKAIVKLREVRGKIESVEVLRVNRLLSDEKMGKVLPYLDFSDGRFN